MDNGVTEVWLPESIPDPDTLYYRVHKDFMEGGRPKPGAFRDQGDAMSTDWSRYGNAQALLDRAPTPSDNIVVQLNVGKVRSVQNQTVIHTPVQPHESPPHGNRAHTDVKGAKKNPPETRLKLRAISQVVESVTGSYISQ